MHPTSADFKSQWQIYPTIILHFCLPCENTASIHCKKQIALEEEYLFHWFSYFLFEPLVHFIPFLHSIIPLISWHSKLLLFLSIGKQRSVSSKPRRGQKDRLKKGDETQQNSTNEITYSIANVMNSANQQRYDIEHRHDHNQGRKWLPRHGGRDS